MNFAQKIEAILFYKNEPVSFKELAKILDQSIPNIKVAVEEVQNIYKERGIVVVMTEDEVSFGTNPEFSSIIENLQKEELSRDLGRAGLETLSIILYKSPISRREIDYIRGVNSGFIIRNLLIRGLVERTESETGERSFSYKPTITLYQYLGITKKEDLPEYGTAFNKLEEFSITLDQDDSKGEDKESNEEK
jgi:segregation and condensation protein B